jgi:hypothetical protein
LQLRGSGLGPTTACVRTAGHLLKWLAALRRRHAYRTVAHCVYCRLGLPDYALLQSPVGTSSAGSYQTHHAAAAGLHGMGSMGGMRGDTPPLDHAALSAQVNLAAGFGLGGLGNGERGALPVAACSLAVRLLWLLNRGSNCCALNLCFLARTIGLKLDGREAVWPVMSPIAWCSVIQC